MKAVEKNLYNRNGYFYFRCRLPQFYASTVNREELTIALGTKDYSRARLQSAQIGLSVNECISYEDVPDFDNLIQIARKTAGINRMRKPVYMTEQGYKVLKQSEMKALSFSIVTKDYLEDCPSDVQSTIQKKKSVFAMFTEIMGDLPLNSIQRKHAREFKKLLLKLPPNIKKLKDIQSYADIDWKNLPEGQGQSPRTINIKLSCMVTLFNWAKNNDLYQGDNPFSNLNIKGVKSVKSDRKPFNQNQLEALFHSPVYKGCKCQDWNNRLTPGKIIIKDSLYWVPLIALYTGMRMNEICQLDKGDIKQQDGIWYIDINDEREKRLKNKTSIRIIPVHKKLIELGFLNHIRNSKYRLFDDIPLGHNGTYSYIFSKRFSKLLKALDINNSNVCFHSFRHNFIDAMRFSGANKDIIMRLVGHGSSNSIHDNYGNGYDLVYLSKAINSVDYNLCSL